MQIGDIYECEGRITTRWEIKQIITPPRGSTIVKMKMVDGIAVRNVSISDVGIAQTFKKVC